MICALSASVLFIYHERNARPISIPKLKTKAWDDLPPEGSTQ